MGRHHALLIGIDAYDGGGSLAGCVNDIDAIQRVLIDRVKVDRAAIRRLVSPRTGAVHHDDVESHPATLAHIREGLEQLQAAVEPGDRALIYYSGHGTHHVDGRGVAREALLPKDKVHGPHRRYLFDWELNQRIAAIAKKTDRVTVVLDCCAAEGVTRSGEKARGAQDRYWPSDPTLLPEEAEAGAPGLRGLAAALTAVPHCQVIAACRAYERARESLDDEARAHGELTRALLAALAEISDEELGELRWGRIWRGVEARVWQANPRQTPWLLGGFGRSVFGFGADGESDVGYRVEAIDGGYRLDVGHLHGVTEGAELAVYASQPLKFPSLGSAADLAARRGRLVVRAAEAGHCVAEAQAPFALPGDARGRLVRPGPAARLRVCLVPPVAALAERLLAEAPIALDDRNPEVALVRQPDGAWAITDELFGAGGSAEEPTLVSVPRGQLDLLPAILAQYLTYITPVRLARACHDLPGALRLTLLDCKGKTISPSEAPDPQLPPIAGSVRAPYELRDGDELCYLVENRSDATLSVTVIDCAGSGRVQLLGEGSLPAHSRRAFWFCLEGYEELGEPFVARLRTGRVGLDRLVAIGTTTPRTWLRHLASSTSFVDILGRPRSHGKGSADDRSATQPAERWTSVSTVARITR